MSETYPRISSYKKPDQFRARLAELGLDLPCDDQILRAPESPLAQPLKYGDCLIGNRWAVQPMEGWDGTPEGLPSEFTLRRWRNFGRSGAKLIWGGEAAAVRHEGRANPNQLLLNDLHLQGFEKLLGELKKGHEENAGSAEDLYVGLQLTHSGRFCRPNRKDLPEPRIAYRHPLLDQRVGVENDNAILSDDAIARLVEDFVHAAFNAAKVGFHFVDIKHCHGYFGHELLSAYSRPGRYGGSFENRTRFLREVVAGIHAEVPGMDIGVRLSAFDFIPFHPDPAGTTQTQMGKGIPEAYDGEYRYSFGTDPANPIAVDLTESIEFVKLLLDLGIRLVNITGGSPYYVPHIQRPALFPPSDAYSPPEDPLVGVHRLLNAARIIKKECPEAIIVGTGFTYLQDFLPQVGQAVLRDGWVDFVGLGRMVLSYPEMPHDVLYKGEIDKRRICRTFSDCTTGPRKGLVSGCYPLDPFYKKSEMAVRLKEMKEQRK